MNQAALESLALRLIRALRAADIASARGTLSDLSYGLELIESEERKRALRDAA